MGRRKIKIEFIRDDRRRQVTLNKRKQGLMKKAHELSVLCGCELALILFDSKNKLYQYGSGEINGTIEKFASWKGVTAENFTKDSFKDMDDDTDDETDMDPTIVQNDSDDASFDTKKNNNKTGGSTQNNNHTNNNKNGDSTSNNSSSNNSSTKNTTTTSSKNIRNQGSEDKKGTNQSSTGKSAGSGNKESTAASTSATSTLSKAPSNAKSTTNHIGDQMSRETKRRLEGANASTAVYAQPAKRSKKTGGPKFDLQVLTRDHGPESLPAGVELRNNAPMNQQTKVQPILTPSLAARVGLVPSTNTNASTMPPRTSYMGGTVTSPGGLSPWLVDAVATLHQSNQASSYNGISPQPPTFQPPSGFTPGTASGPSGLTPTGFTPMMNALNGKGPFDRILRSNSSGSAPATSVLKNSTSTSSAS